MKKFLSLVLALIMTMSLVTIGAGATEYRDLTDKDEIQYEEAVAVLNRIGVITGYDDGSFQPTRELTRGAAAKIIVSLLIGPEAASNLPNATAPYPDVPASHTFAGVISYCKTAGIISGYGDGTFKPGNSLTGFAFAKMLLGALGYKSEIEGFVDTGWTMNVAKVANVTGLLDRLEFDGAAAVNREEACQLALNTLKATMVTYGGTTLVSGAQNLAVANTQAMYVTSNNREINANINRRVISAANNEMTLEFGEEHFKDLRLEHDKYDPAYDDFGHPSNEWSYKKVTIGTFKLPADFTYTTQIAYREDSAATKEKALGLRGYDTYSTDHRASSANWSTASSLAGLNGFGNWNSPFADATQITINGWNSRIWDASYTQTPAPATTWEGKGRQDGIQYSYDAGAITAATKDQAPSLSEIADLTDNGVTVEVYVCPVDADFITNVVVTRTQLMEVDRIGTDFVTLERISPDSRDPRRTPSDGLAKITGYNAFAVDVDVADVKDNNYDPYNDLKDLKVGDRVAVVPYTPDEGKTYEVGVAYVPETVSGRLSDVGLYMNTSKTDGNAISITIGGTKYVINEWNLDMLDVKKAQINSTRKDVTAYLAADGTVLWTTEIGNSDAWMIVGDYYQATNTNGKVVWFAHGWTIGGEEVDLDLGTIRQEAEVYAPGELVHYRLANSGTGEYDLEKPNNTGFSSWYNNDGDQVVERRLTKKVNGVDQYSGEGIYNVAQYVLSNNASTPYEIHAANSLIPLEDYTNYRNPTTAHKAVGGGIYWDERIANPAGDGTIPDPANLHEWNYRSTTYKDDGVKFIYVNFDAVTGEVDYISVRKDAQNVENAELAHQNTLWSNVATNINSPSQIKWVVSPAEAYVNDEGNVEAVVIKSEPVVADLSNVVIVGEYVGTEIGRGTGAEETTPTNAHAREYWQGPNFSEKKTGYFKNQHNVGDIVVIRSTTNDVMDCKMFNGGTYSNRNPDVFKAAGIEALKNSLGEKSKIAFYVGKGTDTVTSQDELLVNLKTSGASLMTNKKVEAEDLGVIDELGTGYAGLIKVAGAKWIDLRANRGNKDVRSLSDLLDLNEDTVRITVLVNANDSTDTFRRAYAIVVTGGSTEGTASETKGVNGTEIRYTTKVYEKTGAVSYTVTAYRPTWVPSDASLTLNGTIDVDGWTQTVTGTSLKGGSSVVLTGVASTGFADASSEINFKWNKAVWSKVKVESNADEYGLTVSTTELPTEATGAITFTNPGATYKGGTVTIKQGSGNPVTYTLTGAELAGGQATLSKSFAVGIEGAVTVTFDLTKNVVDSVAPTVHPTEYTTTIPAATPELDTYKKRVASLEPGVYVFTDAPSNNNPAEAPFDQLCDPRDTRTFVVPLNGEAGTYKMTIEDSAGTEMWHEDVTSVLAGTQSKVVVNVQVSKNNSGDVFHNSGTGSMESTPLAAGTYTWAFTSPSGKVLSNGTITVEDQGMIEGNTGSTVADVGTANKPADIMKPDGSVDDEATANERQNYYIQQIKNLQDGAYTMPDIQNDIKDATDPLEALDIGSTSSNDVRLWKITARGKAETYTFYLYDKNGTSLLHKESVDLSAANSAALFSLQVTGDSVSNKPSENGGSGIRTALSAGTYHWVVRSGDEIVKQGDIII